MSLAHRVIPVVLTKGRTQVKGTKFNPWRSVGIAAQAVKVHQQREVDELVLLDVVATREGRGPDLTLVEELTNDCFMPLAVGGGVRSLDDVRALLGAGADKIVIGTVAAEDPLIVRDVSKVIGCQAVVVAVDVRGSEVYVRCGAKATGLEAIAYAKTMEELGAGEIILTSIDREGLMCGYDLDLIRAIARAVDVPVVAHGGCRDYGDMLDAIHAGASAVAAGALFQFSDATPMGAAVYLHNHGIEARL